LDYSFLFLCLSILQWCNRVQVPQSSHLLTLITIQSGAITIRRSLFWPNLVSPRGVLDQHSLVSVSKQSYCHNTTFGWSVLAVTSQSQSQHARVRATHIGTIHCSTSSFTATSPLQFPHRDSLFRLLLSPRVGNVDTRPSQSQYTWVSTVGRSSCHRFY
jgi:hypothetical protein